MENRKIPVESRNGGGVFYTIPEDNITRIFAHGEEKKIDLDELKKLQYVAGGEYVLKNCLIIKDREALEELNLVVEPEYFYTEKEILNILENGSLDELEDMLNFAPKGVIEMVHQLSVRIELPDTRKRKMILDKTGFNISGALAINEILNEDETPAAEEQPKVRKAKPVAVETSPSAPQRKATAPTVDKYKVVSKK